MTSPSHRHGGMLKIALVNNMPDSALSATQAQFARLVRAAAKDREIEWRCYALPSSQRSETARRYLERSHEDIEALYRRGADALIVTGCEPRAARLDQEPYWPHMQKLVDWARANTVSTILSCLAAHAATLHLDGLERTRMPKKVSGVYSFERLGEPWISEGAATRLVVPHSRYNGLAREALESRGFIIGSWSDDVGVDMYWREEPSLFVFLQGHPEYDADSLLKEYRRDVLRFLAGESADYPELPDAYFSSHVAKMLQELRERIQTARESGAARVLGEALASAPRVSSWSEDAARLYRNWICAVSHRKALLLATA